MLQKYLTCIILFTGFALSKGNAQQLSDITRLTADDYTNLSLPPLDTLFHNAQNNPQVKLNEAIIQDEIFQLKI